MNPATYPHLPPNGAVGVAVSDNKSNDHSAEADTVANEVESYLQLSGIAAARTSWKGMGGVGDIAGDFAFAAIIEIIVQLLVHLLRPVLAVFRGRKQRKHLPGVSIQLGDNRGNEADAKHLLVLLPKLEAHLADAAPNRRYSYVIFSSTPEIDFVTASVPGDELLDRRIRQMMKMIGRNAQAETLSLYMAPAPLGTMKVACSAHPSVYAKKNNKW